MARLRLEINLKTGIATPSVGTNRLNGENFASTIVRDIGLKVADSRWEAVKRDLRNELKRDVEREIEHIARRYVALTVNAPNRGSVVKLTSASQSTSADGNNGSAVTAQFSRKWDSLSPSYVARKRRAGLSPNHFLAATNSIKPALGSGDSWVDTFGPVKIRVSRITQDTMPAKITNLTGRYGVSFRKGSEVRFGIAKVEVSALGRINARMVPALRFDNGPLASETDGRTNGLLGVVSAEGGRQLAYRLGGNSETTPYRATLEPFLGFVLTRAIPTAVGNRVRNFLQPKKWGMDILPQKVARRR